MKIIKIFSFIALLNLSGQAYSMSAKCVAVCLMATAAQGDFFDDFLYAIKLKNPVSSSDLPISWPSFFNKVPDAEKECPPCVCRCDNMIPFESEPPLTNEQCDMPIPACKNAKTKELDCDN